MAGSSEFLPGSGLSLIGEPVVALGPDGVIVGVNDRLARLLGSDAEKLIGGLASEHLHLYDEAGLDWWSCQRPLEADPLLLPRLPEMDLQLRLACGRTRPVLLAGRRHADASGGLALLVLTFRPGERRRRLDASRSELVSTVSHELRSPLTSVKGFTKTLLVKWDRFTDEQRKQMLATVHEDADRVTRLLTELLDVSRIDAGRLHLRRQMVDVPAVIRQVCERMSAGRPEVRFAIDAEVVKSVYADPDKVGQVLTNLVENALLYGSGTVTLSVRPGDEELVLAVDDQGDGIDPRHLSHIFTKFFRPPGEHRSGTGLGLYISRGIVNAHGGRIWAESTASGARFTFTLPYAEMRADGTPGVPS